MTRDDAIRAEVDGYVEAVRDHDTSRAHEHLLALRRLRSVPTDGYETTYRDEHAGHRMCGDACRYEAA